MWIKHTSLLLLTLLILFTLSNTAQAQDQLPICPDRPTITQNCTFITPALNCTGGFNYDVLNSTGDIVINNAQLQNFSEERGLYQFNFTLVSGVNQYVVQLCDGTTREVFVGAADMSVPTVVEGQLFFFAMILIISFIAFLIGLKHEDPVFGFVSGTGFIISGFLVFSNPFNFSTAAGAAVFGKATFLGLTAFGIALIVLGIYVLFSTVQLFILRKRGAGINDEEGQF